jgi:glycosyltransferase involved in cell wall biosynthesis
MVHTHLRWDFVWQRPQQVFSRLAKQHRVIFLEEAIREDGPACLEISEPLSNILRVVPKLSNPSSMTVDSQYEVILPLLKKFLSEHPTWSAPGEQFIQWFYTPMPAPCALDKLDTACVVYDCMDELANFRFAPPDIGEREALLLRRADVVFTGGYHLYRSKSQHHSNVHFYGCGVDADHFGQARMPELSLAEELVSLPRPIFGYFGVIDERLDYDLLRELALTFPQASIVMVGPAVKVDPEQLPRLPNIHWLGQRSYADLPRLVKGFDVCLMPFAMNEATQYINPTKTLEYMAAGKPIVSTPVPDVVNNFADIVAIADTHDDFIGAVANAYRRTDQRAIERGIDKASASSWDAIVASMRGHIIESIHST